MAERVVNIDDVNFISELFGNFDENAKILEKEYGVVLTSHNKLHMHATMKPVRSFRMTWLPR